MGKKDKGTKPLSGKQQRKQSAAYLQGSGGSDFAAKRAQRERDANTAARAAEKKGGASLSLYDSYAPVSRPFVPTQQVPIEQFVKDIAARDAARGQGRKPREEQAELPTHNFPKMNFSFITPAFSGLENEVIEFAGQEFPPIGEHSAKGSTYLHVRNTSNGWEIERHFLGGWSKHQPMVISLPQEYTDKDGMIAKLERWVRDQKAKDASLSFFHMSVHAMASMVNPKTDKPAPTRSSERAKQWGAAVAAARSEDRSANDSLITPRFYGEGVYDTPFTIMGREFKTRPAYGDGGTCFVANRRASGWEVIRMAGTVVPAHREFFEGASREDIMSDLASWVRQMNYEKNHSLAGSEGDYRPGRELVTADSDGFKSPFDLLEPLRLDPNELTYG